MEGIINYFDLWIQYSHLQEDLSLFFFKLSDLRLFFVHIVDDSPWTNDINRLRSNSNNFLLRAFYV